MTTNLQFEHFELPAFWASALINNDYSGLEDSDRVELDQFVSWMKKEYGRCLAVSCNDEPSFTSWHDARRFGVMACDVLEYVFDVPKRQAK